jgi:hypothetical protein
LIVLAFPALESSAALGGESDRRLKADPAIGFRQRSNDRAHVEDQDI